MAKRKDASCEPTEQTTPDTAGSNADKDVEPSVRTPKTIITPVKKRIGESRNNLQSRGDWYQRRTGSGS
jgi:hypothetical protein